MEGIIIRALSGFYYVESAAGTITCRARGKFRYTQQTPLVGDRVRISISDENHGTVDEILPRKNAFDRPAVANIDQLIIIAAQATPITEPFLIDRITALAAHRNCDCIICINKCDLDAGEQLFEIYQKSGFQTLCVSAETGQGIAQLEGLLSGKCSVFTGNSGVGKSSILNKIAPSLFLPTGEISQKLGRGKHTTRHIELYHLNSDTTVADTPGFSSFLLDDFGQEEARTLAHDFIDFRPYLDSCKYLDCSHTKEDGCAILQAVSNREIESSRHESYLRLYQQAMQNPAWQKKRH